MKKLLVLLLLFSCAHNVPPISSDPVDSTVEHSGSFVKVLEYQGFSDSSVSRLEKAIEKVNETVKSDCFKNFMEERDLIETNNKSQEEVVIDLRSRTAEVNLVYYNKTFSYVSGYTYQNTNKIWLNWKYYKNWDACDMANNLAHETSHKFGYGHSYEATITRPFTVPYSINVAFDKCCVP